MSEHSGSPALAETRMLGHRARFSNTNAVLLFYWAVIAALAWIPIRDEIFSWRVGSGLEKYFGWAVIALVVTVGAQIAYMQVARSDGRPIAPLTSLIFIIVNGVLEAFIFMAFYTIFFQGAKLVFGSLDVVNFLFGFLGFFIYSGFIHAFFWARMIPPHFSSEPRLQKLRKLLTPIQTAIVLSWCIYYYFTGDIWTIVALHIVIDCVLMFWVRPPLLFAPKA